MVVYALVVLGFIAIDSSSAFPLLPTRPAVIGS